MKIAVLSDVHGRFEGLKMPEADVYVFSGDITSTGWISQLRGWRTGIVQDLLDQDKKVVAIPGNHEVGLEKNYEEGLLAIQRNEAAGFYWLLDSGCEIDGVSFWGSPWTPVFGYWAYMLKESQLAEKWKMIPNNIDVLVTHGPPYGVLDRNEDGDCCGSYSLSEAVKRVRPKVHCFGHIHEGYGMEVVDDTVYVNGSICTLQYKPINKIQVVEINKNTKVS